jgi:hypothetical protein
VPRYTCADLLAYTTPGRYEAWACGLDRLVPDSLLVSLGEAAELESVVQAVNASAAMQAVSGISSLRA